MIYPFIHDCRWRGPFYIWSSHQIDENPPEGCEPVWECAICGAQMVVRQDVPMRKVAK